MLSPLLPPLAASWLSYAAVCVLLQSPAIRVYDAGKLPYGNVVRRTAFALAPDWLMKAAPHSSVTAVAVLVYTLIAAAAFVSWCWAMRRARRIELGSCAPLLLSTAVIAVPLLFVPGLLSDDVYLYDLYGRAISVYGANPVLVPPSAFVSDPHLPWVHWKELPSAYGPIWLMFSADLSAAADSLTAAVLLYRAAGAVLHLAVVALVWRVLRQTGCRAPLAGAIFYAWNPLVLLEAVANAHNDVLVALFAVLLVGAAIQGRWTRAACFAACAVMVKPFAVLLLPVLGRTIVLRTYGRTRIKQLAAATAVVALTALAVSLPLWSGVQLVKNAINNPAAHMYSNTLWELMSELGPRWFDVKTVAVQHPYLDALRGLCFAAGIVWVLTRRASRHDVPKVAVRLWLVFCLTACWVWPWYFVPALALAPLAGASQLPAAMGLTIGGLLFWTAWPERNVAPLEFLYSWRSLLLFGPLLLMWTSARARSAVFSALGMRSRVSAGGDDPLDVPLRTAA